MRLFVATSNAGKLRDFRAAAAAMNAEGQAISAAAQAINVTIHPLPGLDTIPAPDETADTFEGNARLKAEAYSLHAPGDFVLADDSGLEVDALDGKPGVRSARFAHDLSTLDPTTGADASNNTTLLHALANTPNRSARYLCALAVARNGTTVAISHGTVEGAILTAPRGTGGFGYDPLFYLPELQQTMAQVATTDRLRLSHRARALRTLLQRWRPA